MSEAEQTTLEKIHVAARREFSEKGFRAASLRNIVKAAGVTTGAFYGYFSSKEALFASIVEPHAAAVMGSFMTAQTDFAKLPLEEQPAHLGKESSECLNWVIDYMYEHYEDFKILVCCSEGTPYENFINSMVEVEVESTLRYIEVLRELGNDVPEIDRSLCHMITSGMFEGAFEVIRHDMPKERAVNFVNKLFEFHTAGWLKIMGQ
ncbi:MAG: TetR/AcrR family transcriptional regulator [Bacteroides sp.]|nr:TetR/AcrR family transcriptional regulator [Eubacterium sp.]MCM1419229.1 TetR/AcrR family transcriptional regulator [Roseburia sp.]MCM1463467.1 TetR/AcrR family transcriptional regulator [Bacteroides sp.]